MGYMLPRRWLSMKVDAGRSRPDRDLAATRPLVWRVDQFDTLRATGPLRLDSSHEPETSPGWPVRDRQARDILDVSLRSRARLFGCLQRRR